MLAYVSNFTLNEGKEPESIVRLKSDVAFTKPTLNILPSAIPIEQLTFSLINCIKFWPGKTRSKLLNSGLIIEAQMSAGIIKSTSPCIEYPFGL